MSTSSTAVHSGSSWVSKDRLAEIAMRYATHNILRGSVQIARNFRWERDAESEADKISVSLGITKAEALQFLHQLHIREFYPYLLKSEENPKLNS